MYTFDESNGLFQSVGVLVAIVQDVGADGETGRAGQIGIDLVDGEQHRLQRLSLNNDRNSFPFRRNK